MEDAHATSQPPTPEHILQIGTGFLASKTLLSAVELELFTVLGSHTMTAPEIGDRLGLHPRGLYDFLDALVAMGLLARDGDGPAAPYANTPETALFLDKNQPAYVGGILEMANARLYGFWGHLTDALRTGEPQNEARHGGDFFGTLYSDEQRLEQFLRAMQGIQLGNFMTLAETFDFSDCATLCDVGGANGTLCALVARRHPHLECISFDLPAVKPVAERHVQAMGVADRVSVVAGDFFADELPRADVITMGNILHDWDEGQKRTLIAKAHRALRDGGRLVAIEAVIDDARRQNLFGLLMSLNMLIEVPGGFDYTGAQFDGWCRDAGFARTEVVPLTGPMSAAIAYK
jgi:SAM-dependent methyltransferase